MKLSPNILIFLYGISYERMQGSPYLFSVENSLTFLLYALIKWIRGKGREHTERRIREIGDTSYLY